MLKNIRETRRRKLKSLIDQVSNGNIADFARKIDKEPSYVARMLYPEDKNGAKPIGEKMVFHMCHVFILPPDWFDRDDDEPADLPKESDDIVLNVLDVYASAGFGSTSDLIEIVSQLRYVPEQYHQYFRGINPDHIQIINIKGDSMQPTFKSGDLAFVDVSTEHFDGDGVYVFTFADHLYIKRLQKAGRKLLVISDNETYEKWEISGEDEYELFIHGKVKVHQSQQLNFIG